MTGGLPQGWRRTTIGELGRYLNGRGFKKSEWRETGRPIIRIQNLTGSGAAFNYYQGEVEDRYVARPGDLLVSWAATLGAYFWNGPEAVVNQHIFKVESNIDRRFHKYLLDHKLADLMRHTHGSGMVHITRGRFDAEPVHVPVNTDEQRRIVEILEHHLEALAHAEAQVSAVLRRLDVLERSMHQLALRGALVVEDLSEGTGHDLTSGATSLDPATSEERMWPVPAAWTWSRIGDLFTVSVGTTPSRGDASLWNGGVPWVSSGEVAFNRIKTTRETIAPRAVGSGKRIHPPGTVMLAMIGEGKTRGQAAVLDIEAAHNQNCASIRVSETRILPEFVFAFLKERYLETRRASSGGNQPALNKGRIQGIPIPVPPLGTQRRIVEELDRLATSGSYLRQYCRTTLDRDQALRAALLTAAFEGKLTGRHTDDEVVEERAAAHTLKEVMES